MRTSNSIGLFSISNGAISAVIFAGVLFSRGEQQAQAIRLVLSPPEISVRLSSPWTIVDGSAIDAGRIRPDGSLIVAHGDPTTIEFFDSSGKRKYSLPKRNDLFNPVPRSAIAVQGSRLIVYDPRRSVAAFYEIGPADAQFNSSSVLPRPISDVCFLHDIPFAFSAVGAGQVLRLSATGGVETVTQAVGVSRPRIQEALNESRILCLDDRREFLVAGVYLPTVHLISETGETLWSGDLPHFRGVNVSTDNDRVITYKASPSGYQRILRAIRLSPELAGIEVVTVAKENPDWFDAGPIETRIIDLKNGKQIGKFTDSREILDARNGTVLLVDYKTRTITRNKYSITRTVQ